MVAISLDTHTELWRHERPRVATLGGPAPKPIYTDVGDPVGSGIALANGVVYFTTVGSGKLVALDAATGSLLKEISTWDQSGRGRRSRAGAFTSAPATRSSLGIATRASFPRNTPVSFIHSECRVNDEIGRLGAGNRITANQTSGNGSACFFHEPNSIAGKKSR